MYTYKEGCAFEKLSDIKGKKVTIMGLGLNGGGEAAVRFFVKHGASVTVTDMKDKAALSPTLKRLSEFENKVTYVLGKHRIKDFSDAYCVIKNPGVKIEGNKYLAKAKNIETDISIFLHFSPSPIIAVTGSKGKSSTVSAIHYGLKKAGFNAFLGGNITVSPLTFLDETQKSPPVVLELSSWQLSDLRGRKSLKPFISLITKIVPDHQNWYSGMEDYVADKRLIYAEQDENDFTIVDYDSDGECPKPKNASSWGNLFASETHGKVLGYSRNLPQKKFHGVWEDFSSGHFEGKLFLEGMEKPITILKELSVPGRHMRANVLNAALVMYLMKVEPEKIMRILSEWQGLEHRLQYFHTYKNVKFYNDSCATVPEAAVEALSAFEKNVIMVSGGTDKALSFSAMAAAFSKGGKNSSPKALFLLSGTGTDKLILELEKNHVEYKGPFENLETLLSSLKKYIDSYSTGGDVVVFSPGATSFGLFSNEFDRGKKFMDGVKTIFLQDDFPS